MSVKKYEVVENTCDICGKVVDRFPSVSEQHPVRIARVDIEIWYGSTFKNDVCRVCSDYILDCLKSKYKDYFKSGQGMKI